MRAIWSPPFWVLIASVLLLTPNRALGGVRPSFSLDYSAWNATEIAVVETSKQDGIFQVTEVWKGTLRSRQLISLPELRPAPDAVPISLYPDNPTGFVTNE